MNMNDSRNVTAALRAAIASQDPDVVEEALNQAFRGGLSLDLVPYLIEILELPWHIRHEDVAHALQDLKPPEAVQALRRAALVTHDYLDYDEFFGLARKCTWALADIGTTEAKAALEDLSEIDNPLISGYALKRLDNWEKEKHRKGA